MQVAVLVEIGVSIHGMNEVEVAAQASAQEEMEIQTQLVLADLHLFVLRQLLACQRLVSGRLRLHRNLMLAG